MNNFNESAIHSNVNCRFCFIVQCVTNWFLLCKIEPKILDETIRDMTICNTRSHKRPRSKQIRIDKLFNDWLIDNSIIYFRDGMDSTSSSSGTWGRNVRGWRLKGNGWTGAEAAHELETQRNWGERGTAGEGAGRNGSEGKQFFFFTLPSRPPSFSPRPSFPPAPRSAPGSTRVVTNLHCKRCSRLDRCKWGPRAGPLYTRTLLLTFSRYNHLLRSDIHRSIVL